MCDNPSCFDSSCTIPYGLCHCGCGQTTKLSKQTRKKNHVCKGTPNLYVHGHSRRQNIKPKSCKYCGKTFTKEDCCRISDFKVQQFCSRECYHNWCKGVNHYNWKNGVRKGNKDGYLRNTEGKFIHRVVMEEFLGRPLFPEESVHHIDGDKTNNQIENLRLFSSNSEHRKFEVAQQKRGKDGRFE